MEENKGTLVVDLDGTLCPVKGKDENYEDLIPYHHMVTALRQWKNEGFRIMINTARNMRTYEGNLGLINANTSRVVMNWLDKWDIPFDEILFGKPWPGKRGFYIDDRAIRPHEFLEHTLEELEDMLEKAKLNLQKGASDRG